MGYSCHMSGKFTNDLTSGEWACPGFDSWWAQLEPVNDEEHLYFSEGGTGRRKMPRDGTEAGNETLVAARYTENFVRGRRDTPWFACFWPHAPHGPHYPLDKYAGTHEGDAPPTPFGEPGRDCQTRLPSSASTPAPPTGPRARRGRITGAISARSRRSRRAWTA